MLAILRDPAWTVRGRELVDIVMNALVSSGLAARRLDLEVTESVLIEEGQSTTYTHTEAGAILTASLKNNLDLQQNYPHLYAQHKSLPEQVRQAVLAALKGKHASPTMLQLLDYKAAEHRRLIGGKETIIHCHHYNARLQHTIEQVTEVDGGVRVRVRNAGGRAGREVVQAYASRPESGIERPAGWLVMSSKPTSRAAVGGSTRCTPTWRQASSRTQAPIGTIMPVSSASGMNAPGGTSRPSRSQRISASTPSGRPSARRTIG